MNIVTGGALILSLLASTGLVISVNGGEIPATIAYLSFIATIGLNLASDLWWTE